MTTPLDTQIAQLAQQAMAAHGLKLVSAKLLGGGRHLTVQVLVEKPDGSSPTLDECSKASRTLSTQLDVADLLTNRYLLEVSTPGLDRPLTSIEDYQRYIGRHAKVQFVTKQLVGNGVQAAEYLPGVSGIITAVTPTTVTLAIKHPTTSFSVAFNQIRNGHLSPTEEEMQTVMKKQPLPGEVYTSTNQPNQNQSVYQNDYQERENNHGSRVPPDRRRDRPREGYRKGAGAPGHGAGHSNRRPQKARGRA